MSQLGEQAGVVLGGEAMLKFLPLMNAVGEIEMDESLSEDEAEVEAAIGTIKIYKKWLTDFGRYISKFKFEME